MFLGNLPISNSSFCKELPSISKLRWMNSLQIHKKLRRNSCLSSDVKKKLHMCCMRLLTVHKASIS